MEQVPSRKEKRESKFYLIAENGNFTAKFYLFLSEVKSLKKEGFDVYRNVPEGASKKKQAPATVSWANAYKSGIPLVVAEYIRGEIKTFPYTENWAQKLYVIAARADYVKQHKSKSE